MPLNQDRAAFGRALAKALKSEDYTHQAFAETLAERMGRDRLFSKTTVTRWVSGENIPDPEAVFAIEELLGLPAGSLSRPLGYLPAGVVETPVTVPAAVEADVGLTAAGRRIILKVYEELVDDGPGGS